MPEIKLLDKSVAELIAAGEVIERPSSVIKELCENSIDAGSQHISIEIKNGGISYMRITDDGCGIAYEQLGIAFLRHATSKLETSEDLFRIGTMGFRGEALASVAAVAKVEMISARCTDELGGRYEIEGGTEKLIEKCGCPVGTTIVIRDLFFNTPARLKFLKKDISEGNFIAATVDRLALSHPEISFKFIRDNKLCRQTSGDGNLLAAVKSVYGRQTADTLIPIDYSYNGIEVSGYTSSPLFCRPSRNLQIFFVNGRYIKSTTVMAAAEEAYKNSIMTGKYPAVILNIVIPFDKVDVNVHPAKTEVKFSAEKQIFDAVYLAVKNALLNHANDKREIKLKPKENPVSTFARDYYRENPIVTPAVQQSLEPPAKPSASVQVIYADAMKNTPKRDISLHSSKEEYKVSDRHEDISDDFPPLPDTPPVEVRPFPEERQNFAINSKAAAVTADESDFPEIYDIKPAMVTRITEPEPKPEIRVIGEFLKTYIICEAENNLIIIDKHAAHERIRFEKLKKEFTVSSQLLLEVTEITVSAEEYEALSEYYSEVEKTGVELMFTQDGKIRITALPTVIKCSPAEIVSDIAKCLINHSTDTISVFDDMLHTMACKSAIKANDNTDVTELTALAKEVWENEAIRFCPHGRPVMTALKQSEIERFFGRTV